MNAHQQKEGVTAVRDLDNLQVFSVIVGAVITLAGLALAWVVFFEH